MAFKYTVQQNIEWSDIHHVKTSRFDALVLSLSAPRITNRTVEILGMADQNFYSEGIHVTPVVCTRKYMPRRIYKKGPFDIFPWVSILVDVEELCNGLESMVLAQQTNSYTFVGSQLL